MQKKGGLPSAPGTKSCVGASAQFREAALFEGALRLLLDGAPLVVDPPYFLGRFIMKSKILAFCAIVFMIFPAVFAGCETHSRGKQIFQREKCVDCHTIKGTGGAVGPNLTYVGNKRSREYIIQQIKDPKSHNNNTAMPSFKDLSDQDLKDLVDYLASLK
jgi:cytochrome c553